MRISGTEPSSVILSQTEFFERVKNDALKCQNKVKPKGWCNKLAIFNEFKTRWNWCSQNATNQPKSTVQLGYMCPRGLFSPAAVALTN